MDLFIIPNYFINMINVKSYQIDKHHSLNSFNMFKEEKKTRGKLSFSPFQLLYNDINTKKKCVQQNLE